MNQLPFLVLFLVAMCVVFLFITFVQVFQIYFMKAELRKAIKKLSKEKEEEKIKVRVRLKNMMEDFENF
ncbi:MAG: hypothetical protein LBJ32_04185 [Oscillospiraceae bacterium]|jgi:hypothetical protein|nr:hypothetical protein [Oscillospiraceae bacterium]